MSTNVANLMVTLLNAANVTGAPQEVTAQGDYCFAVNGAFGGATVGLEQLGPDGAGYIAIKDANGVIAWTAAGSLIVSLPVGLYRATVVGGAAVSLFANLKSI